MPDCIVGVDISKAHLDVYLAPVGEAGRFTNDAAGFDALDRVDRPAGLLGRVRAHRTLAPRLRGGAPAGGSAAGASQSVTGAAFCAGDGTVRQDRRRRRADAGANGGGVASATDGRGGSASAAPRARRGRPLHRSGRTGRYARRAFPGGSNSGRIARAFLTPRRRRVGRRLAAPGACGWRTRRPLGARRGRAGAGPRVISTPRASLSGKA